LHNLVLTRKKRRLEWEIDIILFVKKSMTAKLDSVDQHIIAMLGENGRYSNVEIAATIGVSHSTIKKRIDRLLAEGVCRVLGVVNPEKVGFGTSVFLLMKTRPDMVAQVAESLATYPEVYWIGQVTGRYDIVAEVILRDAAGIFDLVTRDIARIPGILSLESLVATRQTWWRPMEWRPSAGEALMAGVDRWDLPVWRGDGSGKRKDARDVAEAPAPEQLDETDIRIIALLQENGRRSAAEIARLAGITRPAAKGRIDRLLESGVCKVIGVVGRENVGLAIGVHVYISTEPNKTVEVGDALARMPEIAWLSHTTGQFDILAEMYARTAEEAFDLVASRIAPVPGVRSTDISIVVRGTEWRPAEWRPDRATRGVSPVWGTRQG
jgi:DNA-binding Lrp family transcriptional regulator